MGLVSTLGVIMNPTIILGRYRNGWVATGIEDPRRFMAVITRHADREGTREGAIKLVCEFHIPEPRFA